MINRILKYFFIFILLVLLQILLFNNIQFSGYINPYVYVFIILILPAEIQNWLLLIIAFTTGLSIDIFTGTLGLHASATLLAGFVRPYILRFIAPRDGYKQALSLSSSSYGMKWYLAYVSTFVFIHHFALFYMEVFRLTYLQLLRQ